MAGRQIRIGAEPHYFFIDSVTSTSVIEIGDGEGTTVNWPRETNTSSGWTIFQHRYALPSDCEDVLSLSHNTGYLEEVDGGRAEVDFFDPDRSSSGDPPRTWWFDGENSSNVREIGVWPYPTAARILRGQYARIAPTLATATVIDVSIPALVYGTAADAASMMVAKEGTSSDAWIRLSSFLNGKYKETVERAIARDSSRHSEARSIRLRRRQPLAHDHTFFPSHFTEGF